MITSKENRVGSTRTLMKRESAIADWIATVLGDGGIERYDDLHIDQVDGAACSVESPAAIRSQDCCRQWRLYCPDGASQSGKIVKVFLHGGQIPRRTQMQSRWSSWL